jgi:hypothetical protein
LTTNGRIQQFLAIDIWLASAGEATGAEAGGRRIIDSDVQSTRRQRLDRQRARWVVLGVAAAGAIATAAGPDSWCAA